MKIFLSYIVLSLLSLAVCMGRGNILRAASTVAQKPIVVLYENDVHCGVEGYTKMAGLRDAINATDTATCICVSCGDYVQGGSWGAMSDGGFIIDLMNAVGYEAVTIGNHEFDYGMDRMFSLTDKLKAPITCVNMTSTETGKLVYDKYVMTSVGGKKIAFVGVVTPSTEQLEYYAFTNQPYSLNANTTYSRVQEAVNEARAEGADYVVVLSHLGEKDYEQISPDMIKATHGIDCVLDGHTHSVIPDSLVANDNGALVPLTQTGTKFANIGKLYISKDGTFSTSLIPTDSVSYSNARVTAVYDSIYNETMGILGEKLCYSPFELVVSDSAGQWVVRSEETNLGDLVADVFASALGTDIGLVNGGGLRTEILPGEITYGNIVDCLPYFDNVVAKKVPGSVIVSMLAKGCEKLPSDNGSFLQVSGLKFEVEMSSGVAQVRNVMVLDRKSNTFSPIDTTKDYTFATTDYVMGDFAGIVPAEKYPDIKTADKTDTELIRSYMKKTGKVDEKYAKPAGRITIR